MADIMMSLDETLEVDAVIEEWNSPSDVITDSDDQFDVSGIQTNTGVLNPKNAGEHKITVNGQELTVKVTDPTTIPDSVVTQFSPETFNTGNSEYLDDIRGNNMSLNGDLQSTTLSNGDPSVEGDGNGDYGLFDIPTELSGSSLNSWAVEYSIQTTQTDKSTIMGIGEGGDQRILLKINEDVNFNTDSGNLLLQFKDDSGNRILVEPSTDPNINDGDAHSILWNVKDASTSDVEIWIDGTNVSLNFRDSQNPTSFFDWTDKMGVWSSNFNGSVQRLYAGQLGKIRLHGSSVGSPTF